MRNPIIEDTEARFIAAMALAQTHPRNRECWTDHRIVGLTLQQIADREGVTKTRIQARVRKADRLVLAFIGASA